MATMSESNDAFDAARRVAAFFDRFGDRAVASAYVFGSRAEGRGHRESDIDVAVLLDRAALPTRRQRFDAAIRVSAALQADLGTAAIDLVVLNDAPPLFARRIVIEGRRVHCRDLELDHAFIRDVQLRAADLAPFLERMRAIKLEALSPR